MHFGKLHETSAADLRRICNSAADLRQICGKSAANLLQICWNSAGPGPQISGRFCRAGPGPGRRIQFCPKSADISAPYISQKKLQNESKVRPTTSPDERNKPGVTPRSAPDSAHPMGPKAQICPRCTPDLPHICPKSAPTRHQTPDGPCSPMAWELDLVYSFC